MVTFVEVNREALRHNVRAVLGGLAEGTQLMAVVKANAYGHGLVEAARVFVEEGAQWLGVSTVGEGVALREAGLAEPVLVFLPAVEDEVQALVRHGLTATVVSVAGLRELAVTAERIGQRAECHVYVDGGLSRIGGDDSLPDVLDAARAFPAVGVTGVYTHFGPPGSGKMFEEMDILREGGAVKVFSGLAREAAGQAEAGRLVVHAAASGMFVESLGMKKREEAQLGMVRVGTLLYGQYPDHVKERPLELREDTFALKSRIVAVHTVPAGAKVGYGGEFVCRRETKVATVPVGTAQGLGMVPQSVAGRGRSAVKAYLARREARRGKSEYAAKAMVEAKAAPIIGRISMDQCCVDVTEVAEAAVGMAVTLPVRRLAVDGAVERVYVRE
ncbi:MAG: alanine racemase [Armatimonadia bacterium]